jgi:hypothetical protein
MKVSVTYATTNYAQELDLIERLCKYEGYRLSVIFPEHIDFKTYELFLPYITEFYVTHVKGVYDADTYMIPFEHLYNKQEVIKEFDGHRVVKYTK